MWYPGFSAPQHRAHSGVVLFTDFAWSNPIRAIVLDLEHLSKTREIVLKKVSAEAFEVSNSIVDPVQRKNLERRMSMPLIYGQQIEWNDDEVDHRDNIIKNFKRSLATLEARMINREGQILLEGLINPQYPDAFYTSYFDYIQIPRALKFTTSPNVYMKAWISCNVAWESNNEPYLTYRFSSFKGICSLEKQMDVALAPWNVNNKMYSQNMALVDYSDGDSEDDLIIPPPNVNDGNNVELVETEAYLTGDRTFILLEQRLSKCIMPLKLDNIIWQIGKKYTVSCYFNKFEHSFMVYKATGPIGDFLSTDPISGLIKSFVVAHPTFRGVFDSDIFGLVDDPECALAYVHLTKYSAKKIAVTLVDNQSSCHGQFRFSIVGIADKFKEAKYKRWLRECQLDIPSVYGVVVERGVVSSEHMPIIFRFGKEDKPPCLGTHIIFDAHYDNHTECFHITNWQMDPEKQPLLVVKKHISREIHPSKPKQTLYLVNANLVSLSLPVSNDILFCEEFGLLDDPQNLVPIGPETNFYDVWVKATTRSDDYQFRARTSYHVVAFGKNAFLDGQASILNDIEQLQVELQERLTQYMESVKANDRAPVLATDDSADSMSTLEKDASKDLPKPPKDNVDSVPENDAANDLTTTEKDDTPESVQRYSPVHGDRYFGFKWHESAAKYRDQIDEDGNRIRAPSLHSFGHFVRDFHEGSGYFAAPLSTSQLSASGDQPIISEPPCVQLVNSNRTPSNSSLESMKTECGGIDPARHVRFHSGRAVKKFAGPVLASAGSGEKYNVVETLSLLKHSVPHGKCGNSCDPKCPWLSKLAELIVQNEDFFYQLERQYPRLHCVILEAFNNVEKEEPELDNIEQQEI